MRVITVKTCRVFFEKEEELRFTPRTGAPPGFVTELLIVPTRSPGGAVIKFVGYYHDPFIMENGMPKRRVFSVEVNADNLELGPEDPVMQFLGKLNIHEVEDTTMVQFMKEGE